MLRNAVRPGRRLANEGARTNRGHNAPRASIPWSSSWTGYSSPPRRPELEQRSAFCGPATVSVTVDGKTFKLGPGQCVTTPKYISVNIGVLLARATGKRPNYFGVDVGAVPGSPSPPAGKDGSYRSGITLVRTYANKSYAVDSDIGPTTATLSGNRTWGTVTGKAICGQTLAAKFHC